MKFSPVPDVSNPETRAVPRTARRGRRRCGRAAGAGGRRSACLTWLLAAVLAAAPATPAAGSPGGPGVGGPSPGPPEAAASDSSVFRIERVADGVWAAIVRPYPPAHAFANSLVVAGDSSALIVDTQQSPVAARELVARLPGLTDRPVRWVVNTHRHADHHRGNVAWREAHPGVTVVSLSGTRRWIRVEGEAELARDRERVRLRLEETRAALAGSGAPPGGAEGDRLRRRVRLLEQYGEALAGLTPVPADVAFEGELEIDLGGRIVRLLDFGAAHSEADLVVHVPDAGVVAAGDLLEEGLPYVADADPESWLAALRRLRGLGADVRVPGHGSVQRDGTLLAGHLRAFGAVERWLADPGSDGVRRSARAACRAAWGVGPDPCRRWLEALGQRSEALAGEDGRPRGAADPVPSGPAP